MKKFLGVIIVLAAVAGGLYFAYTRGYISLNLPGSGPVVVPVRVEQADGVGALKVELTYDAGGARATKVEAGEFAPMLESNLDTPGRIVIGILNIEGIQGDGPVALIHFDPGSTRGETALKVKSVQAYHAETRFELAPKMTDGKLAASGDPQPVVINFGRD